MDDTYYVTTEHGSQISAHRTLPEALAAAEARATRLRKAVWVEGPNELEYYVRPSLEGL
jgi:hypothetical protein